MLLGACLPQLPARAAEQPIPAPNPPFALPIECFSGSAFAEELPYLQDNDYITCYPKKPCEGELRVQIDLSALSTTMEGFMIHWKDEPGAYSVSFDSAESAAMPGGFLCAYFSIPTGARTIQIAFGGGDPIAELAFYAEGSTPEGFKQAWEPTHADCDLMIVSAHMDDEHLFLGGLVPDYAAERGYRVTMVYLTDSPRGVLSRQRDSEALAGLWSNGLRHYPIFMCFPGRGAVSNLDAAKASNDWKAMLKLLVEYIRRYKPAVVVTLGGEYGNDQHRLVAWLLPQAVTAAKDEKRYKESAEAYGTHEVSKLYIHSYEKGPITLDLRRPLSAFGGATALEMAQIGFSYHVSQHFLRFFVTDEGYSGCGKFGLRYSAVGKDLAGNDLFENIETPPPTPEPTPEPTPTPEPPTASPVPTDTPPPTAQPTQAATPSPDIGEPVPARETNGNNIVWFVAIGAGLLFVLIGLIILGIRGLARRR